MILCISFALELLTNRNDCTWLESVITKSYPNPNTIIQVLFLMQHVLFVRKPDIYQNNAPTTREVSTLTVSYYNSYS